MKPGDVTSIAGYSLKLDSLTPRQGSNYRETVGKIQRRWSTAA